MRNVLNTIFHLILGFLFYSILFGIIGCVYLYFVIDRHWDGSPIDHFQSHVNSSINLTPYCRGVNEIPTTNWNILEIQSIETKSNFEPGIIDLGAAIDGVAVPQEFYWVDFIASWLGCNIYAHPLVIFISFSIVSGLFVTVYLTLGVMILAFILNLFSAGTDSSNSVKGIIIIILAPFRGRN